MMVDGDNENMRRLRSQRMALAEFGLEAFQSQDLDDLLFKATQLVSKAMDVTLVKVLEHLPERGEMLVRSGVNWKPGVVGHVMFGDDERSPGGFALKAGKPVISPNVSAEKRFEIPDVLIEHGVQSMINVIVAGEERPFGVLEVDSPRHRDFDDDDVAFIQNYANLLAAAIDRIRSHEELKRRASEQSVLARELSHRVNNILGLVQALAMQTSVNRRSAKSFRTAFLDRLQALATAERLVFEQSGSAVDLQLLAEKVLAPYRAEQPNAISIDGSPCQLTIRNARMLGLALHELATNACKHGALSVDPGHVRLTWQIHEQGGDDHLMLHWQEVGGPEVKMPKHSGFGTQLLTEVMRHELRGTVELSHPPRGLQYRLTFPIE